MFLARSVVWQLVTGLILGLITAPAALAVGWFDDFNDGSVTDGNPLTWSNNPLSPFFDGTYDASSGDYHIYPNDATNPIGQVVTWVDSVDFSDTYARTQGVVLPDPNDPTMDEGNLVLLARLNPTTVVTYVLYFDLSHNLGVQRIEEFAPLFDESVDILEFNASSESIIELNVVNTEAGVELRGFAWQPGQPKPETPQLVYLDEFPAPPASGKAGLAFAYDDDFGSSGIYRYAMAQDTPFVDVLAGDYNLDGTVDAGDYPVWRDTLNTQETYDVWAANFGNSGAGNGGAAAVPEPAGLAWVLLALSGAAACVRGRKLGGR